MGVRITVRGAAESRHPAERAVVRLEVAVEDPDREGVRDRAVALQEPLRAHLGELVALDAVEARSADQLRVHTRRLLDGDGGAERAVHVAALQVHAEFRDVERLSGFVDHWAAVPGVDVHGITWDLGVRSRRLLEAETRKAAVDDAVAKAQAYADAVRRGRVVAVELADPGMLDDVGGELPVLPVARAVAAEGLALVPEDITLRVEVDARFVAD
jgi:uncharacterized protein YggE